MYWLAQLGRDPSVGQGPGPGGPSRAQGTDSVRDEPGSISGRWDYTPGWIVAGWRKSSGHKSPRARDWRSFASKRIAPAASRLAVVD